MQRRWQSTCIKILTWQSSIIHLVFLCIKFLVEITRKRMLAQKIQNFGQKASGLVLSMKLN